MILVTCMSTCHCLKHLWAYFLCSSLLYSISSGKSLPARATNLPHSLNSEVWGSAYAAFSFILPHRWSATNSCWFISPKYSSPPFSTLYLPPSSLVQAIIYGDEQDCLAKNPGSSLRAHWTMPSKRGCIWIQLPTGPMVSSSMKEEPQFPTMPKACQCWISKQRCKYLISKFTLLCTKAQS